MHCVAIVCYYRPIIIVIIKLHMIGHEVYILVTADYTMSHVLLLCMYKYYAGY